MKKILTILGSVGMVVSTTGATLTVTSCTNHKDLSQMTEQQKPIVLSQISEIENQLRIWKAIHAFASGAIEKTDYEILYYRTGVKIMATPTSSKLNGEIKIIFTEKRNIDHLWGTTDGDIPVVGAKKNIAKAMIISRINTARWIGENPITEQDVVFEGSALAGSGDEIVAGHLYVTAKESTRFNGWFVINIV
ncbi:hypothetical protein ELUMI_v1c08060 [Williamsoniiplasma luminosum]|uniref:Lipoprotein n=1 Tax=Williamsoniiplasma luminosum TaxID=214888 RepID=A0A2K8NUT6_9MOLU|nr:hypothetical protein [Williamsoniiplasma luminosum]ATZ17527.1 hypothetical protein ELUMI_v1c08060 [Williamsoniiplasma luminosum]